LNLLSENKDEKDNAEEDDVGKNFQEKCNGAGV